MVRTAGGGGTRRGAAARTRWVATEAVAPGAEVRIDYETALRRAVLGEPPRRPSGERAGWRRHRRRGTADVNRLAELQRSAMTAAVADDAPAVAEAAEGVAYDEDAAAGARSRDRGAPPPLRWEGGGGGDERLRVLVPFLHVGTAPQLGVVATHLPGRAAPVRRRWLLLRRADATTDRPDERGRRGVGGRGDGGRNFRRGGGGGGGGRRGDVRGCSASAAPSGGSSRGRRTRRHFRSSGTAT